jgi:hypothetical protein
VSDKVAAERAGWRVRVGVATALGSLPCRIGLSWCRQPCHMWNGDREMHSEVIRGDQRPSTQSVVISGHHLPRVERTIAVDQVGERGGTLH